jgi:hypothetical protein
MLFWTIIYIYKISIKKKFNLKLYDLNFKYNIKYLNIILKFNYLYWVTTTRSLACVIL